MKALFALLFVAVLPAALGCRTPPPALEPPPGPVVMPAPSPSPTPTGTVTSAAGGPVMAVVNGKPVYMADLHAILVRGQGLEMGWQLLVNEVVHQEAERRGIAADETQVRAEEKRLAAELFPTVPEAEQKERLLAQMLAEKGWSRVRWELICQRNALLRQMVEPNVIVTDEMLRTEYAEQFGRKVQVRHIQVEGLDEAEKVLKQLRAKADFATLATKVSKNPSAREGGLLPPMSPTTAEVPESIRKVAFSLKQVGDISEPVKEGYTFHILRLEKIFAPTSQPSDAARTQLREALRERLIRNGQQQVLVQLMNAAKYEFTDPVLREMNAKVAPARP
jgi:foldase protein PrsA